VGLVTFPLYPKPHECIEDDEWVKDFWIGSKEGAEEGTDET